MGNDISVGSVTNINVADISPHLSALVEASSFSRPHGRVFTNLRCRYSRSTVNSNSSSSYRENDGVVDALGVVDGEVRWEEGVALSVKVYLRSYDDKEENLKIRKAIERALVVDKALRTKAFAAAASAAAAAAAAAADSSSGQRPPLQRPSAASAVGCRPISVLHQEVLRVTDRAIWMARPWVQHSVIQRVQMRPYCSVFRRLFFAYQMLRALTQLHDSCGMTHGDLKCENVLVDSHGWVYLTDVSTFYKPTLVPAYDPEVFEARFNTGVKSSCTLAPERFVDRGGDSSAVGAGASASASASATNASDPFKDPPKPASDIFSAASVIVSIMNDVACFMSLSDVLALRKIILSGDKAAAEKFYRDKMVAVATSAGMKIMNEWTTSKNTGSNNKKNDDDDDHDNDEHNNNNNNNNTRQASSSSPSSSSAGGQHQQRQRGGVADMIIEMALGKDGEGPDARPTAAQIVDKYTPTVFPRSFKLLYDEIFPGLLSLSPDMRSAVLFKNLQPLVCQIIELDYQQNQEEGGDHYDDVASMIDVDFFSTENDCTISIERVAKIKHLSRTIRTKAPTLCAAFECLSSVFVQIIRRSLLEQSLLTGLSLLARAAPLFPDAILRDPLLPLVVTILQSSVDTTDTVRAFALDALVCICASLGSQLNASNAFTFEDYVMPALCECGSAFGRSPATMVTLARALPVTYLLLSEVAERREAMGAGFQSGYGYFGLRQITVEKVWDTMKRLLTSSHTAVVTTALRSLPPLLPHLSVDIVVGQVLPLLTLWLGSSYVELRREMFRTMFDVIMACGPQQHALATVGLDLAVGKEDDVMCIAAILEGLRHALLRKSFPRPQALEYVKKVAFLITHSSREVARAAAGVIDAAATTLDPVELSVFVFAPISPFLRAPLPVKELVRRNYDVIKPMCRVPDATGVTVVEGAEYVNWCRDLGFVDLAPQAATIAVADVDRAALLLRESGTDMDPYLLIRLDAAVQAHAARRKALLLEAERKRKQSEANNTGEEGSSSSSSSAVTTEQQSNNTSSSSNINRKKNALIMFNVKVNKLTPKLLQRQQQRLNEIAVVMTSATEDISSPWWSSTHTQAGGSFMSAGALQQQQPSSRAYSVIGTTAGGGRTAGGTSRQGRSGTVMISSAAIGSAQMAGQAPVKKAKPTGVSVASHTEAHNGGVRCMVSQMQFLATGGGDGSVRVWDTEDAILGAGYLDGRTHRRVFDATIASPPSSPNNARDRDDDGDLSSVAAAAGRGSGSGSSGEAPSAITALHFVGAQPGHTLVVGNESGEACVYNVVGEASEKVPWAYEQEGNLGSVISLATPGSSEALLFLGMAGGVVGAVDLRAAGGGGGSSSSSSAIWTAKTPCGAGPLVNFMFPNKDNMSWAAVSVNRSGLIALWDLRMRAIVSSMDITSKEFKSATSACICEGFVSSPVPSVAVSSDSSGIHRIDLNSMKEMLQMRPTTIGSVRTMTSSHGMLYSSGTDSLIRSWDLQSPERSFTVSRGLEPSPPYSFTSTTVVAEALPAAVDLMMSAGGGGGLGDGWVDLGGDTSSGMFSHEANGSPLHSDEITAMSVVNVTPSAAGNWGSKSFGTKQQAALVLEPDQIHVCTGSRDGSIALWRNGD